MGLVDSRRRLHVVCHRDRRTRDSNDNSSNARSFKVKVVASALQHLELVNPICFGNRVVPASAVSAAVQINQLVVAVVADFGTSVVESEPVSSRS